MQHCGTDERGDAVEVTVQFSALLGVVSYPDKFSGAAHRGQDLIFHLQGL